MDKYTAGVISLAGAALFFVVLVGASSSIYAPTSIPVHASVPPVEGEIGAEEDVEDRAAAPEAEESDAPEDEATRADAEGSGVADAAPQEVAEATAPEAPVDASADAEPPVSGASGDEAVSAPADTAPADDLAAIAAAGDVRAGGRVWRQCGACHVADQEQNRIGPHLVGIIGRQTAAIGEFNYSDALAGLGGTWTAATIAAWIEKPADYAPGNRMSFAGLSDAEDRVNLLAYLADLQLRR